MRRALVLFQLTPPFDGGFLVAAFVAGGLTASFYGWLPLYLPELFPTKIRATGQGFSFNFGDKAEAEACCQKRA